MAPASGHCWEEGRPLVFISAAEPSADLHGAALIRATIARCPTVRFVGVAGPRMVEAGCEQIFDMTRHSAMLLGALKIVGRGIAMLQTCDEYLRRFSFDGAVVIDSPILHLPLAGTAQGLGIPVLYYIAPQLWAWGESRMHRLRYWTERVAVIFPFEEAYFRHRGIEASYVGHPLAERVELHRVDQAAVEEIRAAGDPVVALLPGSRQHVVNEVFGGQLDVADRIRAEFPAAKIGVSVANDEVERAIDQRLDESGAGVEKYFTGYAALIQAADLVLVASGTAALEVAFHRRPMIVMYNASRLFYQLLGRWMIRTRFLSLPNIIADREIVPEFMPYYTSTAPIAERAIALLRSKEMRRRMVEDVDRAVAPLRGRRASEETAAMFLDMIARARH